ncbi:hypothetical protein QY887_00645 [Latilactobacillus sakei]
MTERKDITQAMNTDEQSTTKTYTPSELVKRIDGLDSTAGLARSGTRFGKSWRANF